MQFRVYPARNGQLYFEVRVYRTKAAMRRALNRHDNWLGVVGEWGRTEAACRASTTLKLIRRRWRRTPRLGVVFFHRGNLGAGIVAHEMTHAAVNWAIRTRLSGKQVWGRSVRDRHHFHAARLMPRANERFAWAVGSLCSQFWSEYYARRARA